MAKLTPQEFREKHARRLTEAVPDMERGIDRVTVSPMAKAAGKADKAVRNYAASKDKMVARLLKVSLPEWQEKFKAKLGRVPEGIQAAAGRMEEFGDVLLKHTDAGQKAIEGMADNTPADMEQRMLAFSRHMRKLNYRK